MQLSIPHLCLVVLIGPSGAGKSSFARRAFAPTEVISSDFCRGLVCDDENAQDATADAFDVLKFIASRRLARGKLTVIDATNVQPESRRPLVMLAREHDVLPVAIVLKTPEEICRQRNRARPDRQFGPHVVRNQCMQLRRSLRGLQREGFRRVHILDTVEQMEQATIVREALWNDRRHDHGPFDIIGDVHGCYDELIELLERLGYTISADAADATPMVTPPAGRKAVFLGDLVDRGPDTPAVLKLVMGMVEAGTALCVPGNHDVKLMRKLRGRDVQVAHGLAQSLEQLEREPPEFRSKGATFIDSLVSHYVLDGGALVVAHAGMKQQYIGRASSRVRDFALYGDTTGETDEFGLPVRNDWAAEYRGDAAIVYGHTPVPEPQWLNNTINIDTGCVFGGRLTALRWPERELVSVPARQTYAEPKRVFLAAADSGAADPDGTSLTAQQQHDDVLDVADVLGKRIVTTRLLHTVTVREENGIAALEVMSRFAVDPKWLIYLPPTMSPCETSTKPGLLEHPDEAFDYYASSGVGGVVCQEKHMGSRAVAIVCRDESVARARFGTHEPAPGIIYTRTGRRFFDDPQMESQLLAHLIHSVSAAALWDELRTDWLCLDCELMPWSVKARELLRTQYAAVGSSATASTRAAVAVLEDATVNRAEMRESLDPILADYRQRLDAAERYVTAYRRYCWAVRSVADLKLAPFHVLASEKAVHADKDHLWHMQTLSRLAIDGSPIVATPHRLVNLADDASHRDAVGWWEQLTASGGEGIVVKPLDFIARGGRGLLQPAVKCRGREYLRIIYGPEYTMPENLDRLRERGLSRKRSLALREFALGMEALERFIRREPLRRVHECVFGVLALESEPVDPRL